MKYNINSPIYFVSILIQIRKFIPQRPTLLHAMLPYLFRDPWDIQEKKKKEEVKYSGVVNSAYPLLVNTKEPQR